MSRNPCESITCYFLWHFSKQSWFITSLINHHLAATVRDERCALVWTLAAMSVGRPAQAEGWRWEAGYIGDMAARRWPSYARPAIVQVSLLIHAPVRAQNIYFFFASWALIPVGGVGLLGVCR